MSLKPNEVEVEPAELLPFRRPFQHEVTSIIHLRNPHSHPIAFKVKTTAPKAYCVRPNSYRVEPGDSMEVSVLLQAMKEDPAPGSKCKDKFLVQSVAVPSEFQQVPEGKDTRDKQMGHIWSAVEKAGHPVEEKKIRVVWLPPSEGATETSTPAKANGLADSSIRSPSPEAVTPQRGVESTPVSTARESIVNASSSAQSAITSAASAVTNAVPTSTEELKTQLAAANAQIAKLRDDATQGLRQRKAGDAKASATGMANAPLQQAPAGGVPVAYVAGLCLLSFLLAYFLF